MKSKLLVLTLALLLVSLAGCCCQRGCRRPVGNCPPPGGAPVAVAPAPFPGGNPPPGAMIQNVPPSNAPPFPIVNPPANNPSPFPVAPPDIKSEYRWQPGPSPAQVQLLPPDFSENNAAKKPPEITGKSEEPPLAKPGLGFPSGIPGFDMAKDVAKDKVYIGLRPTLEGLDWLKESNFRRVIHIRLPGIDDDSDRKQVESRGMKYAVLEVSPQKLTRETVHEFKELIKDDAGHPLFVYDRDGTLAGPMWYLYFRLVDQLSDDAARVRASSMGLRTEGDGPHRDMWLAVQNILKQ